ncbi:MAG TPA: class I SAM-dependent methyltransferase [Vicinamibacterales bacterium]|nr:class I SAM-dependent methyltransferase [Vicinamibacterales bacterium]
MTSFARYVEWYDAFNADKDYVAEADYVTSQVERWRRPIRTWLDLGCGTGRHLEHLASRGIAIEGVDMSADMIALARQRLPRIPFHVGRIQEVSLAGERDVVSMLFHVMSYQTSAAMVRGAIENARTHLAAGGVFLFDFWHTEAVLRNAPTSRTRQAQVGERTLFRISHPAEDRASRRIDVRFEFRWDGPNGPLEHEENHTLRHFTADELAVFLAECGLEVLSAEGWMTSKPLTSEHWYGVMCARRPGR